MFRVFALAAYCVANVIMADRRVVPISIVINSAAVVLLYFLVEDAQR